VASSLVQTAQADFSAGIVRAAARHLISSRGLYDIQDGLLDDDGSIYQRGGSEYLSTSALGSSLRSIWEGRLTPGQRTLIANPDDFGVLDAADAPINLGLAGLAVPKKAVEVGGVLFIGGGTLYGGSRKTAVYSTGTVTVTQGSKTVTGAGTTWNTLVDAGMLFRIAGRVYPVATIDSTTQLTLRDDYQEANAAGQAYTLSPILVAPAPYRISDLYAVAAGRLFSLEGRFARFTSPDSPHAFAANDYHELPEGAESLGAAGLGSRLLWFTTSGLWTIDGLDFDIVDPFAGNQQHTVRLSNPELTLVSHEGIASWQGRLVVPCADGIWLVDGISEPVKISTSIDPLWRQYVALGYGTGLATVTRSHYIMPVIDVTGAVKDQLVCRLDRQIQTSIGIVRPWTRLQGYGANVAAWAIRTGGISSARNPLLLGASAGNGRVTKNNAFFAKTEATKNDADGTTPRLEIVTRDYATKDGYGQGTVKFVRVRAELHDAGDGPTIQGSYSIGDVDTSGVSVWNVAQWNTAVWASRDDGLWEAMPGLAPADDGRQPYTWRFTRKARFIRYRLIVSEPNAKMVLRSIVQEARPSGRNR
jgi:hypothetical protein